MTESEIINALNECAAELEDLPTTLIWIVEDEREEEGLPPLTAEERAEAVKICDAAAQKAMEIETRMDDLKIDYYTVSGGLWPWYNDATNRYSRNFSRRKDIQ